MNQELIEITSRRILIVEGKEEERFFKALIKHLGIQNIQTIPIGGKDQLRRNLKALVATPGFIDVVSLGVVRDADADPSDAFQSVRDSLQAVDLPVPQRPLVAEGKSPRVIVLILPEAGMAGMLEDLCLKSIVGDPALPCVEQYFECLQQKGVPLPQNVSKAKVQVFLASKPKAGLRLGEAAESGYWPWDDIAFDQVKDFVREVGR